MSSLNTKDLKDVLNWRYATKIFDAEKKIPAEIWEALEDSLVLSPSSLGLQPWKFIDVRTPAVREKLKEVAWGQSQVTDASHLVVFAGSTNVDARLVEKNLQRIVEVRGVTMESLSGFGQMLLKQVEKKPEVLANWAARQVYIALGEFMVSAAALGVDTCAMEGFDAEKFDEILGLKGTGFASLCTCAAGYRKDEDKYAHLAKVRFEKKDVLETR